MNKGAWSKQKILLISATLLLAIVFPHIAPYVALASEILIFALFAMAFDLMLGYAGMLSFGHAAFFGLGAYTAGTHFEECVSFCSIGSPGRGDRKQSRWVHHWILDYSSPRYLLHHGDPGICPDVLFYRL